MAFSPLNEWSTGGIGIGGGLQVKTNFSRLSRDRSYQWCQQQQDDDDADGKQLEIEWSVKKVFFGASMGERLEVSERR